MVWLGLGARNAQHFGVDMVLDRERRLNSTGRGLFPRPIAVLVSPFIKMNELFVADKQIPDIHISISSPKVGWDLVEVIDTIQRIMYRMNIY